MMPLQSHLKAQRVRKITTLIRLLVGDASKLRLLTKAVKVARKLSRIDRVEVPRLQLNKLRWLYPWRKALRKENKGRLSIEMQKATR